MGNQASSNSPGVPGKASAEDFDVLSLIGKGAFGKVWQVRKKDSGQVYAMKVLRKKDVVQENLIEHTKTEREIMLSMGKHPFIINLIYAFQTDDHLFFILDYIGGGSLFQTLSDSEEGCFPEESVRFYIGQIVLGLEALHSNNIVYRDLKLENILIGADGHVVLTDFGLSAKLRRGDDRVRSFSGTGVYLAPEILEDQKGEGHGKSVDYWALGIMVQILLTGMPPFWSENRQELFEMIKSAKFTIDDPNVGPDAADLIHKLVNKDLKNRLGCGPNGISDVKNHRFFQGLDWNALLEKRIHPPFIPTKDAAQEALKRLPQNEKLNFGKKRKDDQRFRGFSYMGEQGVSPLKEIDKSVKKQWASQAGLNSEEKDPFDDSEEEDDFEVLQIKPKARFESSPASSPQAWTQAKKTPLSSSPQKGPVSLKDKRKSSHLAKSHKASDRIALGNDGNSGDEEEEEERKKKERGEVKSSWSAASVPASPPVQAVKPPKRVQIAVEEPKKRKTSADATASPEKSKRKSATPPKELKKERKGKQ